MISRFGRTPTAIGASFLAAIGAAVAKVNLGVSLNQGA